MKTARKTIALLFLLIFIFIGNLLAVEPTHYTKGIAIQGGYESVAAINVVPMAAQSEGYLSGMPFSLDDTSVRFNSSERGRPIAKWNLLANQRFLIDVKAEILHPASEDSDANKDKASYENGLGYILKFVYNLSFYADKKVNTIENGELEVKVPDSNTTKTHTFFNRDILADIAIDADSLVGSAEGTVYFKFDESTTAVVGDEKLYSSLPDGNYTAKVIMTLKVPQ